MCQINEHAILRYSVPFHSFSFISMEKNKTDWSGVEPKDQYEKNYIMGLWKFSDRISVAELEEVTKKWATEDPRYLQLYIRKCSKDQYGIGFTYKLDGESEKDRMHNEYMNPVSDLLKRQFGNDLVGWDISNPVWIIK